MGRTVTIQLPKPHPAQLKVRNEAERFNVLACGRRWGKTLFCSSLVAETALEGKPAGWFAPTYKLMEDAWNEAVTIFSPLGKAASINKTDRIIKLPTGGSVEFWSTEPRQAGDTESMVARGRKYARAVYDEAAHAKRLEADWTKAIRPTLTDYRGDAWFPSTPKGHNHFHKLWTRGQSDARGWASWQMPTSTNPYIDPAEIEDARADLPADAFSQEYLAEFLADAANPFGISHIRACLMGLAEGPIEAWGVDLAKSHDWTVAFGLNDRGETVAFQRWQSDWRNTIARLTGMIGYTPALIDATGVGDPIVEEIQQKCPQAVGYKFTSQSKQTLMEGLAVAIQQHEVGFPEGIVQNELETFMYEYTPSGVRYTAPDGMYDDCVDGLALAVRCLRTRPARVVLSGETGGERPHTPIEPSEAVLAAIDGEELGV